MDIREICYWYWGIWYVYKFFISQINTMYLNCHCIHCQNSHHYSKIQTCFIIFGSNFYSRQIFRGCHGCDCMVVGFTTTYAISANHHWCCEFESHSGEVKSIQHCVIKYVEMALNTITIFRSLDLIRKR